MMEMELYEPIKKFFVDLGYDVKAEVKDCDLVAIKDEEVVVVELKTSFNLKLVYQAIERQKVAPCVYVGIGRSKNNKSKAYKSMISLLKRLDIGLLTVALDSPLLYVQEELSPSVVEAKNKKKILALKKEFGDRAQDFNVGGVSKKKIITAYKEKAIELLCLLEEEDTITLKKLKELGYDKKTYDILYRDFYGWYDKVEKGVYQLSEKGEESLHDEQIKEVIDYYRDKKRKKTTI